MRAIVVENSRAAFQPRHPTPDPAQGDTLIRVRQAGICATDLEIVKGYMRFSGVLGHEFVGEVVSSSDSALVGQRVVGEINVVCGRCDLCLSGLSAHCRNRSVMGIVNHDGCFAEFVRLPRENLHVIPKSVDDDAAVFVEPLAAAFQVVRQLGNASGSPLQSSRKWVTVIGDGRLGLLVAQVMRDAGCPVRVIGKHPVKLAMCEKWGIRSRALTDIVPRHDQDVVIDCTGSPAGFELSMQMVRPRGTIVMKTTVEAGKPMNLAPLVIDEISVIGSRCGPFREAIKALSEKRIDVTSLIHRRMKLHEGLEALELAAQPGVLKVLISVD